MATLKFVVSKGGEVSIEVSGTTGASCEQLTAAFEDALGVKTDIQRKPEYFVQLDDIATKQYVSEDE